MYGMLAMLNPGWAMKIREQEKARNQERLKSAVFVPWEDNIKWQPQLNIIAETFKPRLYFDIKNEAHVNPNKAKEGEYIESPDKEWWYMHYRLPAGTPLSTWYGSKVGSVMFNGDVVTPSLFRRCSYNKTFKDEPWMSLTVAEYISLRGGTKLAKGRVVVAGLGLGHQLIEVSKRKQVKEIVLVEISQSLVDWLLPVIRKYVEKPLKVIGGDAEKILPKLTADVALVDIFSGYGNNKYEVDAIRSGSFGIKKVWGWGTATINGSIW